ncbi:antibiotic biosynthesis monooxygenase [Amycolatopsis mediterranei S699]|uniref:Antibiotic biosynthesis monooxygenase n=2 Tax=Amycolatopsis mediterranei TaxID=33910 RepID=A0A0H3DAS6_AMYMU|nr:antibiotic biosynthesis monooxygenase family protein [Amycolatopsis mediterranei]ADJ47188.1 antibiotic biosynthesis monooxygenase [Amycolatopsis mediterranei U32]AEK44011.1 antibiotic biosynthesis monooxygenase [Amycolatopsis mediterranei S699]AFO78899.1 antibiotic biosynthesis monooxygenase [Amycolatopsis mediterranei S699]AGT86027.1 antibiotic biosynthesis monooxygenase [Amycolatopsis mediterranei RB]KDO04465.1 antibiotic biosynthesis monooxygenase [Amycolatopsis mediterranei]
MSRVRVLIYAAAPESDTGGVTEAYHRISAELSGTPGLLGNELMQSLGEARSFVVMSEWADLDAFRKWETGPDHRGTTSPLRPYQDASRGSAFGLYQVVASY